MFEKSILDNVWESFEMTKSLLSQHFTGGFFFIRKKTGLLTHGRRTFAIEIANKIFFIHFVATAEFSWKLKDGDPWIFP